MLRNKFRTLLLEKGTCVLITSPENRRYLTGFSSTDGFLTVTADGGTLFMDSRYSEAAEKQVKTCRVVNANRFGDSVVPYLKEQGITKVLTEREHLYIGDFETLRERLDFCTVTASKEVDEILNGLRAVKSAAEIEKIRKAQAIAEAAFRYVLTFIHPGVTERAIGLELDFYMLSHGAEALSFETIAVAGAKTAMPHGVPERRFIKEGDFVTLDFGAVFEGYHSDMTRTVCVGKPTEEQTRVYNTVLAAQQAALRGIRAGLSCRDADALARNVIEEAGYGAFFGHGTGHGVGMEIHEKPNLSPHSDMVLRAGNVVTVEPGIYLPGKFGVRIEDMVQVTKAGNENLTTSPKELIVL